MSFLDCQNKVTDELNLKFASLAAEAVFIPVTTLQDTKDIKAYVIPFEMFIQSETRGKTNKTYVIQVGILQKVNEAVLPVDVLAIVETVTANFYSQKLPSNSTPIYFPTAVKVKNVPFYDYENLDESKVVESIIQVTYMELA